MVANGRTKVLIAGGGVAGLETVLALQALAADRFEITMLAPDRHFTYRPLAVGEASLRATPARIELAAIARDCGFQFVRDAVERVDVAAHRVTTQDGVNVAYDVLVLALGARAVTAVEGAIPFRGSQDMGAVTRALRALGSVPAKVAFVAGSTSMWTLPAYELALYTADWARSEGMSVEVIVVTAEAEPLQAFGPSASDRVTGLLAFSGIRLVADTVVDRVHRGCLRGATADPIGIDVAVALPHLAGRAVPGLPRDAAGFTPVDATGKVDGADDVYAVGDMTNRPLKQDGFAAQQADVAARAIAGAGDRSVLVDRYLPVLREPLLMGQEPVFAGAHLAPYLGTHGELQLVH